MVLQFVNRAIEKIGAEAFGLKELPGPHVGEERPGLVVQWKPVQAPGTAEGDGRDDEDQAWLPDHERELADKIAEQVRLWHTGSEPFVLAKDKQHRQARAGDVMVLVRKRGALAALIERVAVTSPSS